jgi:hypothetical protein
MQCVLCFVCLSQNGLLWSYTYLTLVVKEDWQTTVVPSVVARLLYIPLEPISSTIYSYLISFWLM